MLGLETWKFSSICVCIGLAYLLGGLLCDVGWQARLALASRKKTAARLYVFVVRALEGTRECGTRAKAHATACGSPF